MKPSLLFLLLLSGVSLLVGSVSITPLQVWHALSGDGDELTRFIVFESRLPQLLTAILAGGALAVSGLVMQTLFANPLADPALLGVNSGASLGAALALLAFGGSWTVGDTTLTGVTLTIGAAFVGALAVIALITLCSHYVRGNLALLITGVMISFFISALISLLSFYATADGVRSYIVWGLGNFAGVSLSRLPVMAACVLLPCGLILWQALPLNALLLGSDYASNLGIRVKRVRTLLLLLTGLLTATVTALCGPISFIGLAVPHMARLLLRSANHKRLLPLTLVGGANVAVLSLILSHLPGERGTLPLAAITPLMGVPVVLYILLRRN